MTDKTFEKYKLVVDEWFVNGFNGAKAYQKFYPGTKPKIAEQRFSKLSSIVKVAEYIKSLQETAKKALQTSHEGILEELRRWAYSDITETISISPDKVKELPIEIRRLITKYKQTKRTFRNNEGDVIETVDVIELHFVSKEKAMEMIHKHVGFYEKDNEQRSNIVTETREERDRRIEELLKIRKGAQQ